MNTVLRSLSARGREPADGRDHQLQALRGVQRLALPGRALRVGGLLATLSGGERVTLPFRQFVQIFEQELPPLLELAGQLLLLLGQLVLLHITE